MQDPESSEMKRYDVILKEPSISDRVTALSAPADAFSEKLDQWLDRDPFTRPEFLGIGSTGPTDATGKKSPHVICTGLGLRFLRQDMAQLGIECLLAEDGKRIGPLSFGASAPPPPREAFVKAKTDKKPPPPPRRPKGSNTPPPIS
jgi:hypothetical protein